MNSRYLSALAVALFACGKPEPAADTGPVTVTSSPIPSSAPKGPYKPPCEHNGLWSKCSLERRLKQSGFVVKPAEGKPAKRAGFGIEPVVYSLGSSRLEAFFYTDEKSANRDISAIDSATASPPGGVSQWESAPMLIRSVNLAAVLISGNPRQAERAMLAITAGPPQPGSSR